MDKQSSSLLGFILLFLLCCVPSVHSLGPDANVNFRARGRLGSIDSRTVHQQEQPHAIITKMGAERKKQSAQQHQQQQQHSRLHPHIPEESESSDSDCPGHHDLPNPIQTGIDSDAFPPTLSVRCLDCPLGMPLHLHSHDNHCLAKRGHWGRLLQLQAALSHRPESLDKAMNLSNLTVVYLGGSMAAGRMPPINEKDSFSSVHCTNSSDYTGCSLYQECQACAWPARFSYWLQQAYPHVHVASHNLAIGGSYSLSLLATLPSTLAALRIVDKVDLFIIAYTDNDMRRGPTKHNETTAAFEALIRFLLLLPNKPAVLNVEYFYLRPKRPVPNPHDRVIEYYHLPTIYYDPVAANVFKIVNSHPGWPYHQAFSDLIGSVWRWWACQSVKQYDVTVTPLRDVVPIPTTTLIAYQPIIPLCQHPNILLDASKMYGGSVVNDTTSTIVIPPESKWVLRGNPKKKKFGWHIKGTTGRISFKVSVSATATPRIVVGYLQGYDEMGGVRLTLTKTPFDEETFPKMIHDQKYIFINASSLEKVSLTTTRNLCFLAEDEVDPPQRGSTRDVHSHDIPSCNTVFHEKEQDQHHLYTSFHSDDNISKEEYLDYFVNFEFFSEAMDRDQNFEIKFVAAC